jgi:hypothetical protein
VPRPLLLTAAAVLLLAAAAPTMPPPRYDIYDVEPGEAITAVVGKPVTVRLWGDFADSEWRLIPQAGVTAIETSHFHQFPDPDGGVGFTDGEDITVKIARAGRVRLVFRFFNKASGKQDMTYSDKPLDVIAR